MKCIINSSSSSSSNRSRSCSLSSPSSNRLSYYLSVYDCTVLLTRLMDRQASLYVYNAIECYLLLLVLLFLTPSKHNFEKIEKLVENAKVDTIFSACNQRPANCRLMSFKLEDLIQTDPLLFE